jgi:hypothetical protein
MSKKSKKAPARGTVAYAMMDFFPQFLEASAPPPGAENLDGKSSLHPKVKKERCLKEGCKHVADLNCFVKYICRMFFPCRPIAYTIMSVMRCPTFQVLFQLLLPTRFILCPSQ